MRRQWPADLWTTGLSTNKLDLQDITAFLGPVRRIGTSPGDADFALRYDIVPGRGILSTFVNIQDLTQLIALAPPMFGGQRAFGHTCP